jgi:very-short-patch-repair endonuclease
VRRVSNSAASASAVQDLASGQHDLVTRDQMRRVGVSEKRIDSWVRRGFIHRVTRAVYIVGNAHLGERGRIHAAALACGPRAIASHRSAAYLLGIGERSPRVVDLIPLSQRGRQIDGIRFHEVPYPASSELVLVDGIPCTGPARTIVDLAGTYGEKEMREAVERAAAEGVLDLAAIDAVLGSGPRRRGAPCLRRVVDDWRPVAESANFRDARSLFEVKLLPLIATAGLPMPRVNAPVETAERILEVDLLWPEERFALEADSRRHHAIEIAFERDRRRDRELLAAGYGCLRVTWREAEREPGAVLAAVRAELLRRGARVPG